ncbi:ABC-type transport system permease protein (probable substrate phosphate/phosphonate) [Halobacterium hubeiense]|jgi:phosphonate transport system permease protein|uniref:Phosphonate ABC transporter, permease protein PhnE n=2 Tax=Halobacterium TaxID=2239 RepID=A0AAU8CF80_9EURY|nr:phosphonate ABC transporter, permease protein PhnE [Halobacterium hubeiense]CQH47510.1 ABC-type transport system permease protein (probable substrate phosphate/phosphonate) [Halobacterium hubeiense]
MAASERTWERPTVFGRREVKWSVYVAVVAFFAWSAWGVGLNVPRVVDGVGRGATLLGDFFPPDATPRQTRRIVDKMFESVAMAMVSTATGIALSVPIAFMAAENLSPKPLYYLNRGFISVSRAFNAIIVAILVVKAVGLGPLAGIITITFKTVGFFSKLLAEDLEDIDMGSVDAVRASGAGPVQTLLYGVVPQIIPRFAGLSVYRWDINIRTSTIVGIVGAGGIGSVLLTAFNRYDYQYVAAILVAIIAVVLVAEGTSAVVRRRYQ